MARQGEAAFTLDRQRVTVLGRDGHPAFGIEIDCGRALKHVITFYLSWLAEHETMTIRFSSSLSAKSGKISHKKTLFHTDAHFRGCKNSGQALSANRNGDFSNEIKDLARFLEAS
jgi:hypothetical protein